MSSRRMDLVGQKFGRLRVIGYSGESRTRSMFSCECDCGEICIVLGNRLKNGHTKSCGCYGRDIKSMVHKIHGLSNDFTVRGTMRLLQRGDMTLEQTIEIVNMWIELTAKKFYAEGELDGRRRNKKSEKEWQTIRDMGM